jgi:hypothetical protein
MGAKAFIVFNLLLLVGGCTCQRYGCTKSSIIKAVGGCDRDGYCGVLFQDGTYEALVYQPVIGIRRCLEYGPVQ